eukprot:s4034_g6.t1
MANPPPKWGTPFPKGTGIGPVLMAFANQAVAKPKAVAKKAAPKVPAKHAAPSAADGVPKAMPAQMDNSGITMRMRLPDHVIDDRPEVRVSACHASGAPGTVYRESRLGNVEDVPLLYVATLCSTIGEGYGYGWAIAATVICATTGLVPNRYIDVIPGAVPNQQNPGGFLADLGINNGTANEDVIEFYGRMSAIFLAFGLNVTDPSVNLSKETSKFILDVTGTGLPNLQRAEKDELQAIFSVIQKPVLEAILTGRYNIDFGHPVAADQASSRPYSVEIKLFKTFRGALRECVSKKAFTLRGQALLGLLQLLWTDEHSPGQLMNRRWQHFFNLSQSLLVRYGLKESKALPLVLGNSGLLAAWVTLVMDSLILSLESSGKVKRAACVGLPGVMAALVSGCGLAELAQWKHTCQTQWASCLDKLENCQWAAAPLLDDMVGCGPVPFIVVVDEPGQLGLPACLEHVAVGAMLLWLW